MVFHSTEAKVGPFETEATPMAMTLLVSRCHRHHVSMKTIPPQAPTALLHPFHFISSCFSSTSVNPIERRRKIPTRAQLVCQHQRSRVSKNSGRRSSSWVAKASASGVPPPPLDLTEDNVKQALADARVELAQLFDDSVGITGVVELAELDGPFVKISLRGRFWHKRSTVVARVGNYLKQRIPEILEVDIEDEKQLDDSPENF